ncbi:serine/threonine protein kinase [Candidatus Magnetobacterium bavaricum]|uniref:non-specific serine/threonine protein kinase n=1 Tax=Candidatus Magnetobacterium bavaricum TaxID=29290 RepID=A0A0F3GJL2_9BACT|nr:serine/threonine protein kinase [Candidatus Magnetobacterium bavaricum]
MTPRQQTLRQRYRIEQELRRKDGTVIYVAKDLVNDRVCAVKAIHMVAGIDQEGIELLKQESKVLYNLNHPNIPKFIDFFTEQTDTGVTAYLVHEYIAGKNLQELVDEGRRFTEQQMTTVTHTLLLTLRYLHGFSPPLIHRAITPSNIVIDKRGKPYLLNLVSGQTKTPNGYTPQEQLQGTAVTASDLYALGMSIVFVLSHVPPQDIPQRGQRYDFRGLVNISYRLANVLEKMIQPNVKYRYQNANDVLRDMEPITLAKAPTGGNNQQVAIVLAVVAMVVVVALIMINPLFSDMDNEIREKLRPFKVYSWGNKSVPPPVTAPSAKQPADITDSKAVITTQKQTYQPHEPIVVQYSALPGNAQDWLTIVQSNAPTDSYRQWFYTKGQTDGSYQFNGLPPGSYEVRLYYDWPRGGYNLVKRHRFDVREGE